MNPKTGKQMANCSRQMKLEDDSAEYKDRVRRYLWWWCTRANQGDRSDHQKLDKSDHHKSVSLPDVAEMMEVDEYKELVQLTYDSNSDAEP